MKRYEVNFHCANKFSPMSGANNVFHSHKHDIANSNGMDLLRVRKMICLIKSYSGAKFPVYPFHYLRTFWCIDNSCVDTTCMHFL